MLKHTPCTVFLYLVNVISTGIHFIECTTCLLCSYFYKSESKFDHELSLWNVQIVYFMLNKRILFYIKVCQMIGENIHVLSINRLNPFQICSCFCLAVACVVVYDVFETINCCVGPCLFKSDSNSSEIFGFSLSVSFLQWSVLILHSSRINAV
jgi:hypothetical protein